MFVELNNLLEMSEGGPSEGVCMLVREDRVDAGFVLHHLLSLHLRSSHAVCMLGLAQSFNHYVNVGKKLGVDLKMARDKKQLVFIEGLKLLGQNILQSVTESVESDEKSQGDVLTLPFNVSQSNAKNELKQLYQHLRTEYLQLRGENNKALFLIDDLSILLHLGFSARDVAMFAQYLRQMVAPSPDGGGMLVTMIHADADADDEEAEVLLRALWHGSDVAVQAQGLPSGYSKDVHGQLSVIWRKKYQQSPSEDTSKTMQYKLTDKNVNLFARGLSAAVI